MSLCITGVPHPLATKIYHCQRNYQLRFELSQIYHGSCEDGYRGNCPNLASIENGVVNPHATSCINSLHGVENNSFVQTKVRSIYHILVPFYSVCIVYANKTKKFVSIIYIVFIVVFQNHCKSVLVAAGTS